ncbi:hypothetical protein F4X90_17760 [Candidatus Poribacteria bacterium]|nr:hypothetical protein [Candidatus Poribacteria bacterium]
MKFRLFFPIILICLCAGGCADEHVSDAITILGIELETEPVIQTSLPPIVWAALEQHADEMYSRIERDYGKETLENFVDIKAMQREFYTRYIDADGIAIVANSDVEDKHLIEARNAVLVMTAKHSELRESLRVEHGFYMVLVDARKVSFSLIPENQIEYLIEKTHSTQTCTTSSVTSSVGRGIRGFCFGGNMRSFVHEFGHALNSVIVRLKPRVFRRQVAQAYDTAKEKGIWSGNYIEKNPREYFAEGVNYWFHDIGPGRCFETREAFAEKDPLLAEILSEWFLPVTLSWYPPNSRRPDCPILETLPSY